MNSTCKTRVSVCLAGRCFCHCPRCCQSSDDDASPPEEANDAELPGCWGSAEDARDRRCDLQDSKDTIDYLNHLLPPDINYFSDFHLFPNSSLRVKQFQSHIVVVTNHLLCSTSQSKTYIKKLTLYGLMLSFFCYFENSCVVNMNVTVTVKLAITNKSTGCPAFLHSHWLTKLTESCDWR